MLNSQQGFATRHVPPRMRAGRIGLLCALVALSSTSCHKPSDSSPSIRIEHEVIPVPPRVGPATIALNISDASGKAVTRASVTIEGDMSHAGMGPVFSEAKEQSPGRYQAPLQFSMAGDWVILIHAKLSNGQKLERQFDIKGVQN